jgi:subtilisin family serine protease
LARIEQAQQTLVNELAGSRIGATVTGRLQRVYNGVALQVEAGKLDEIRALPGVKAVHPDGVLYLSANNAVPFIGAPTAWTTGMGVRGEGIKIGDIDSGIDYLHRNFGGPGTGYESNDPTIIGDAPGFPGAKGAGGYDFIGDDYDPESEDPANRILWYETSIQRWQFVYFSNRSGDRMVGRPERRRRFLRSDGRYQCFGPTAISTPGESQHCRDQ